MAAAAHNDIADIAAAVLLDGPDTHDGQVLEVTGPEALTLTEIAHRLGDALGRPFRYQPERSRKRSPAESRSPTTHPTGRTITGVVRTAAPR